MGCCFSCCGSRVDPDDPTIRAYVLTSRYLRQGALGNLTKYNCPYPKPVYVRKNKLHFDRCCIVGGYPLTQISSVEVVRGGTVLVGGRGISLNPGMRIRGSDGTTIAFTASDPEVEIFAQQLRSTMEMAKNPSQY